VPSLPPDADEPEPFNLAPPFPAELQRNNAKLECSGVVKGYDVFNVGPDKWSDGGPHRATGDAVKVADNGNSYWVLARVVAAPGYPAMILNENNEVVDHVPLDEAVASGKAFVITLRNHIAAYEFDEDADDVIVALTDIVQAAGGRPVVVASGRPGHRHFFASVRPEVKFRLNLVAQTMTGGSSVIRSTIRPPISPHRLGYAVRLVSPATVDAAVEALKPPASSTGRLSGGMYRLLVEGDLAGRYATESNVVQAIVTSAVNRGMSEKHAYTMLVSPANVGGRKVQEILAVKGAHAAKRYVHTCYDKACKLVADRPAFRDRSEVIVWLANALDVAHRWPWNGSAGQKALAVYTAMVGKGLRAGVIKCSMSEREMALAVGISRNTVRRTALPYLLEHGWLVKTDSNHYRWSATYIIKRKTLKVDPLPISPIGGCEESGSTLVGHDAFRFGARLGKAAWRILMVLGEGHRLGAPDLSRVTGLSSSTTSRILNRLRDAGLVQGLGRTGRPAQEWSLAVTGEALLSRLDAHAVVYGVDGAADRQRDLYDEEREPGDLGVKEATPPINAASRVGSSAWRRRQGRKLRQRFLRQRRPHAGHPGPTVLQVWDNDIDALVNSVLDTQEWHHRNPPDLSAYANDGDRQGLGGRAA
jgi:DNA-binding Lrp family transcriptional regulator